MRFMRTIKNLMPVAYCLWLVRQLGGLHLNVVHRSSKHGHTKEQLYHKHSVKTSITIINTIDDEINMHW